MHVKLGSALLLLMLSTSSAFAQSTDWATCDYTAANFPACSATRSTCCTASNSDLNVGTTTAEKPIIIPMDRCHQQVSNNDYPGSGPPDEAGNGWCSDPSGTQANGMYKAYGLIYRLMQRGVPVYWLVNPSKSAMSVASYGNNNTKRYTDKGIDVWVLSSGASIKTSGNLTDCSGCTPPVKRLSSTLGIDSTWSYSKKELPIRGSAFLISGGDGDGDGTADRTEFNTFWTTYGNGSAGRSCGISDCYQFTDVRLYEIQDGASLAYRNHLLSGGTNVAGAPVAVTITYQPPRIARVEPGGAVSASWLGAANLNDQATSGCETGVFTPSDAVWCEVTEAQVRENRLVTGGFGWAWMDGGNAFSSCSGVLKKVRVFLEGVPGTWGAGNVMANDTKLEQIEKCVNYQLLGQQGAITGSLNPGNVVNETDNQPFLVRYPSNLFLQFGDVPLDFASSSVAHWETDAAHKYQSIFSGTSNTLKRLVSREAQKTTSNSVCADNNDDGDIADSGEVPHSKDIYPNANAGTCDVATSGGAGDKEDMIAYARHTNTALNGIIFYTGGNQVSNKTSHLRMILNSILAVPSGGVTITSTSSGEVARSTPVVPQLDLGSGAFDAVVQGTTVYETPASSPKQVITDADIATFEYPYRKGHMRARNASTSTIVLDAGCSSTVGGSFACPAGTGGIPSTTTTYTGGCTFPKSASNADCRTVFTSVARGDLRAASLVYFDQNLPTAGKNLMKLGVSLTDTTLNTVIQRVIAGQLISGTYYPRLGGVNRSTPAVIPASAIAGDTSRALMTYFGAEDGMLHAVCAEVNAAKGCDVLGRELWAFIPRTALPYLRTNSAHIDGSPRVIDAKIDYDGSGPATATWRTVLMFQTSFGDATADGRQPAVFALDVSDPTSPKVLWEHSMNVSSRGTYDLGVGLGLAAGPVVNGTSTEYWAWAQTSNGGTGSNVSSVVTAINVEDGTEEWQQGFDYTPNPRTSGNDVMVASALPGGVVPLDLTVSGKITDLTFTDLYGSLWLVNPLTGVSRNGATTPLFRVSTDYHAIGAQPSIYMSGSSQYAVFTTGGYADPSNTTWPMECCKSTDGTTCTSPQPSSPQTCAQYNNSTYVMPLNYALAVKLDATATASVTEPSGECDTDTGTTTVACTNSRLMFKRNLGADERGYVAPLIIGTQIFFTTDSQNVNRFDYVGGAGVGHLYALSTSGSTSATTVALTTGATGLGISNNTGVKTVYGSTNTGSFFTATHDGSTGPAVEKADTFSNGASRKAWLRLE